MPILPAFYRHIRTLHQDRQHRQQSNPSASSAANGSPTRLKKFTTNSFLAGKGSGGSSERSADGGKGKGGKDPYPLYSTRGYEELDELEAQRRDAKGMGGIVRGTEVSVVVEDRGSAAVSEVG